MFRLVRIRSSQARRFVPGVYECQLRNARAYVSCIRSSASSRRPDEPSGDAVDLITELKRLLLESHAVACLGSQLAGLGRRHFAHAGHPSKASFQQGQTLPQAALFHCGQTLSAVSARAGCAENIALSPPARACKRLVHRDRLKPVPGRKPNSLRRRRDGYPVSKQPRRPW